jgi:putative phosphoribosyl transferase
MKGFLDRYHAGQVLAQKLEYLVGRVDLAVLALPRGGVPVGFEVAVALSAPLDVFMVRKLGVPGHEELALGAIASGGVRILNADVVTLYGIDSRTVDRVAATEGEELQRREQLYRGKRQPLDVKGKRVVIVDDGLATGASMKAAVAALKRRHPAHIIVAVPVAARDSCEAFREDVDEVVCAFTPDPFFAVGSWYQDFSQTSDEEVRELLEKSSRLSTHANAGH